MTYAAVPSTSADLSPRPPSAAVYVPGFLPEKGIWKSNNFLKFMQLILSGAEFQTRSVRVEITLRRFFPLGRHFLFCPHLEPHRITHRNLLV